MGKQAEWLSNLPMHGTAYFAPLLKQRCLSIDFPRCAKPGRTGAVAPMLAMDASTHPPLVVEIVSCSTGWPQTHCVAEDGLKLQTLLLHPHECWDPRLAPPHPGYGMLGLEALYILGPIEPL